MASDLEAPPRLSASRTGGTVPSLVLGVQIEKPRDKEFLRGASVTVEGTASCLTQTFNQDGDEIIDDAIDSIDRVAVRLGDGAFALATPNGPTSPTTGKKQWSLWSCTFSPITGVVNDSLTITARVTAGTANREASITVEVDRTPPILTVTTPGAVSETVDGTGKATFEIRGTASDGPVDDTRRRVAAVEWALDGQAQFTLANPKADGDWSEWSASVQVTAGPHALAVRASDLEQNTSSLQVISVEALLPFQPKDPAQVFGPAAYLNDLLEFANHRIKLSSSTTAPPLDRATLTSTFRQPFDALADPNNRVLAEQPARRVRLAVEVLRTHLDGRGLSPPAAAGASYRQHTYEALLQGLGTSSEEIRLARAAEQPVRTALAARLGIDLRLGRPDQLDELLLAPDQLTEERLESLFGLMMTARDPIRDGPPPRPLLLEWQLAHLSAVWQRQDHAARSELGLPVPVVDPDLLTEADFKTPQPADPAYNLFTARQQELAQELASIRSAREAQPTPIGGFNAVVNQFLAPVDELVALRDLYGQGEDVAPQLKARQLILRAFLHLMRVRDLASAGTVLDVEWASVYAILVQVHKNRRLDPSQPDSWPSQEQAEGLTLSPEHFAPPDPAAPQPPLELPAWRATARSRRAWEATLRARLDQRQSAAEALQAAVDAAEEAALPALCDALVAAVPAGPPDLMIDLQSGVRQQTTRLDQAIETIQGVLFGVRIGRFLAGPVAAWALNRANNYDDAKFDEDWRWMGAYATWRAAMSAFIYPENHLLPTLRPVQDTPSMDPTKAFRDLVKDVRDGPRLTPARARQAAAAYLGRLGAERPDLPPVLKDTSFLTDDLTEARLVQRAGIIFNLFVGAGITNAHQAPVYFKESCYYVPLLLAIQLQQSGHYQAALGWLRTVYAYNFPPDQRKVYHGLKLEAEGTGAGKISSQFQRPLDWPREGLNPHDVAKTRANALTRFALISLARCFLAFADAEFTRDSRESLPRARALYETALDVLGAPELQPPGDTAPPLARQLPPNPVPAALRLRAEQQLAKLRAGRNIAGFERPTAPEAAPGGAVVVARQPTQYRYRPLVERAQQLVGIAQQVEAAFLAALEKRDQEAYSRERAQQDLDLKKKGVELHDLRITEATSGVTMAGLQRDRAQDQVDHFDDLLDGGLLSTLEIAAVIGGFVGSAAAAFLAPVPVATKVGADAVLGASKPAGLGAAGRDALGGLGSLLGSFTSFARRREQWQHERALARQDVLIGNQQVTLAGDHKNVVEKEREIADEEKKQAQATVDFLAGKFTNTELYEFMSGILEGVYSFFLQQATAVAKLAERQLAFERQETPPTVIRDDYWVVSADQGPLGGADGQAPDRRGLTGSARLLRDIHQLDQYAFETEQRKLQLTATISLAQLAPIEFQRFRETGLMIFGTPLELFDREFPGHYLRQIRRARTTVIALIPPVQGIRATLSTIGTSRIVVCGDTFQTTIVNHGPDSVALTAPRDATGLFELEQDARSELRRPFEGMGVDAFWELRMPKAANRFDFRTIADVHITFEYTALDSPVYRQQVIRTLDPSVSADRPFSFRQQFRDQWYDLHNPDQTATPMTVRFSTAREDFPPNLEDLTIQDVVLYLARSDPEPLDTPLSLELHFTFTEQDDSQGRVGGPASSRDGLYSTRRNAGTGAQPVSLGEVWLGGRSDIAPFGEWELALPTAPAVRDLFQKEEIEDILFVITYSGHSPDWPA